MSLFNEITEQNLVIVEREIGRHHVETISGGLSLTEWADLNVLMDAARAEGAPPTHTDLMVSPESIGPWLEQDEAARKICDFMNWPEDGPAWDDANKLVRSLRDAVPAADGAHDFANMLWRWFDKRDYPFSAEERGNGLTGDDFETMLDEHEASLSNDDLRTAAFAVLEELTQEYGWSPDAPADQPVVDDPHCCVTWGSLKRLSSLLDFTVQDDSAERGGGDVPVHSLSAQATDKPLQAEGAPAAEATFDPDAHELVQTAQALIMAIEKHEGWGDSMWLVTARAHASVLVQDLPDALSPPAAEGRKTTGS